MARTVTLSRVNQELAGDRFREQELVAVSDYSTWASASLNVAFPASLHDPSERSSNHN